MIFTATSLAGSFIVEPDIFADERGWFSRFYCKNDFKEIGHTKDWVQLNHSFTARKGSIRGMHFQLDPFREIKMVKCIAGAVYDVIIDLRKNSSTFLSWAGIELSSSNKKMLYIPEGFAHGFQCLKDDCELIYHHTEFYKPGSEGAIRYDDPMIKIDWPLPVTVLSERDRTHSYLDKNFKGI
jgi:dTDP-4-dehydrorhamnose 3,5-epimerase